MQAVAKGTKIIDEDGLMSLIRAAPAPVEEPPQEEAQMEDGSEDEVAFVSSTAAPSSKAAKLGAELNRPPQSSRPSQPGPSRPAWTAGQSS